MTSLDVARLYTGYGWSVIPVPFRSKNPGFDGWQHLRLTEPDLPHRFNGKPQNVGVLLGEPSNGLVDVDLDCVQAIRLAPRFLPHTSLRFGRPGKPDSHWLYLCDPLVPTERFLEVRDVVVDGKKKRPTLVELRSTRSQTVFPPSTHESGEPITFCAEGVPAVIEGAVLAAHVAKLAAAALLARHWPGEGTRHHAAGALAGGLARAGWSQEDITAFIGAVAAAGGDDQVDQRERLAADSFDNLAKGQHVTGWKRLIEIFGKDVVSRVTKWLGVDPSTESGRAFDGFAGSAGGGFLGGEWPDPQPLPAELPPVMPFHDDLLPQSLRTWITDISDRVQCPPDFPAIAAVVALAAVAGRKVGIRPKRRDDWLVVPNLWGKAIGRPGIMKTPALQEPLKPLKRLEIEAQKEHERAVREFNARSMVADAARDVAKQKLRTEIKKGANLEQLTAELADQEEAEAGPVRQRFIVNDATVEKLGEILNQNPNGVLVYRDELIGLLKGLDKEGQEGARAFYLEAWNGTGRYTYDRIGRGTIDIEVACISVLGATQPGPLADYQRDAVRSGAGDDGLLQRFQVAVWPDVSKDWVNVDRWPNSAAREAAYNVFSRLASLAPETVGAAPDEHDPDGIPFLRFENTAQDQFDAWRTGLEARVRSGDEHPAIESHLAKYRSLIPSLALLFHLADGRRGAVSTEALGRAIAWGTYLETHARRIFSPTVRSAIGSAHALARKIADGSVPSGFALRDVYQAGWSKLSTREDAEEAVELLIDHNWLRETTDKNTGGRPRSRYWINPKVAPKAPHADESGLPPNLQNPQKGCDGAFDGFAGSGGGPFSNYEPDERAAMAEGGM